MNEIFYKQIKYSRFYLAQNTLHKFRLYQRIIFYTLLCVIYHILSSFIHELGHALVLLLSNGEILEFIVFNGYISCYINSDLYWIISLAGILFSFLVQIPIFVYGMKNRKYFFILASGIIILGEIMYFLFSPFLNYGDGYIFHNSTKNALLVPFTIVFSIFALIFCINLLKALSEGVAVKIYEEVEELKFIKNYKKCFGRISKIKED